MTYYYMQATGGVCRLSRLSPYWNGILGVRKESKVKHSLATVLMCSLILAIPLAGSAHIYLDEDFEGTTVFTDRDWPIRDTSTIPTPSIVGVKGLNLRSWDSSEGETTPKPLIANTGTAVSTRYYQGARCLQLASGQSVGISPTLAYTGRGMGEIRFFQFALGCTPQTVLLPPGSKAGHFRSFWSCSSVDTVETSMTISFIVNGVGGVDLVCDNTHTVLGSLEGGCGKWKLVSVMSQQSYYAPPTPTLVSWQQQDILTGVFKGPVTGGEPATFPQIPSGIHIYVNSKTAALSLLPDQVGTGWGNDSSANAILNSVELGWEISSMNGATLFVDNMYWDGGWHTVYSEPADQEQACRMTEFNTAASEQILPPSTDARNWQLFD
jgi:hypothetical protein